MTDASRPIRLSTMIMAHPDRLPAAQRLRDDHPELAAGITTDPTPDGPPSALRASRLAWQSVTPDATHQLVIQDDAILAPGFLERVTALVESHPAAAVSLFTEWGSRTANAVRAAALLGHDWAPVVDDYLPAVALVLPAEHALSFARYAESAAPDATDDVTLLDHLGGLAKLTPVAQPVDHTNPASLVGNDVMGPRVSVHFSAATGTPGSVLPEPDAVPYFCWWEQLAVIYTKDGSAPDGWRRDPAHEALGKQGISHAEILDPLRATLQKLPHRGLVHDRVSDVLLTEVWTTAFALGALVRQAGGVPDPRRPAARAALATLAPGALRRVVPTQWLPAVGELLEPLVVAAVERGAEAAAARGTAA